MYDVYAVVYTAVPMEREFYIRGTSVAVKARQINTLPLSSTSAGALDTLQYYSFIMPTMIIFTSYRTASLNGLYTDPHIPQAPMSFCLCCVLCTVTNVTAHCYVSIMVYYATRQQIKYNDRIRSYRNWLFITPALGGYVFIGFCLSVRRIKYRILNCFSQNSVER